MFSSTDSDSTPELSPSSAGSSRCTSVCSCLSDHSKEAPGLSGTKPIPTRAEDDETPADPQQEDIPLLDVLIIGAGPCGLAVAARIREETPSAMFTDDEHQRYHWIKKHSGKMKIVQARRKIRGVNAEKYVSPSCCSDQEKKEGGASMEAPREGMVNEDRKILVLDAHGSDWMTRWKSLFRAYEIPHLRSPMFFHVDPMDRDGMLGYARETGRERELLELHGCVGQELSKHRKKKKMKMHARGQHRPREVEIDERDRKDYFCPSSSLFEDYCDSIARRYHLDPNTMIQKGQVSDIQYDIFVESGISDRKTFLVRTSDGRTFYAKAVVCAVGPGLQKLMPWKLTPEEEGGGCHSSELKPGEFLPVHLQEKIKKGHRTDVVVVGGGLTSSQVVDNAVRKGVDTVWYIMRGPLKVKHFDMTLNWVGKFRNYEKAIFWTADTVEEKLAMINEARNGGSINVRMHKALKQHIASGRVKLCTYTQITSHKYDPKSMTWTLETDNHIPNFPGYEGQGGIDYIYFATGMNARIDNMPFMQNILAQYPAPVTPCGLPHLTTDLEYAPGLPLFFTGRLATLHLGPGGPNLEGARAGAERIAWALGDLWEKQDKEEKKKMQKLMIEEDKKEGGRDFKEEEAQEKAERALYAFSGLGNRFEALEILSAA
ncbi:hypothetical protein KEM55_000308 [Ascosphaera atra]|nr:hypothetical protein KEM55_000308 [Ascosphaera atra]